MFFFRRKTTSRRKIKPAYAITLLLVFILLVLPSAYVLWNKSVEAADNAFSFWHFDEGVDNTCSGGTNDACDSMATGANDLARTSATWQTEDQCVNGKCLYFDGTTDYLTTGADNDDFDFVAADTFSVAGWFKHPPISTNPDYMIVKHSGTAGGYKIYMDANGLLVFGIDDDSSFGPEEEATSTQRYDDNKWHHFTAVKNGTTDMNLYVDGNLVDTDASIASGSLANANNLYIGVDGDGSSNSWTGYLDEIKYYDYVRTATLVKTDTAATQAPKGTSASLGGPNLGFLNDGLTGYWKLDESSGTAADSSGNSYTLTNNGTTTFVQSKFTYGSEHVPASSQHFSTASTIANVQSVSFWVNPDSTTNYYVSLNGSAYVTSSSGTLSATGFTNAKIYVDGVEGTTVTQDVWQHITVTTDTAISGSQFYIGRQGSNYFDGTMDEVRLFTRQLSPAEINNLYNWSPGPNAHWTFDEQSGATLARTGGMLVYDDSVLDGGDDIPDYRIMNANGTWAGAAVNIGVDPFAATTRYMDHMALFSSPTRNEKVLLVVHSSNGASPIDIYAYVYNGDTGTWGNAQSLSTFSPASNNMRRFMDGAYLADGRFMALYADGGNDPNACFWSGTSWTACDVATADPGGVAGTVQVKARPGTSEAMIVVRDNSSDTNTLYYDGAGEANTDFALLTPEHGAAAGNATAYDADFVWSSFNPLRGGLLYTDSTTDNQPNFNIFTADGAGSGSWGTASEAITLSDDHDNAVVTERPGTNEFLMCVKDTAGATTGDIDCLEESDGDTAPTLTSPTGAELTTDSPDDEKNQHVFVAYEQKSANLAIAVYSDNTTTPKLKKYDPATNTFDAGATSLTAESGITRGVRIVPNPETDDMAILTKGADQDVQLQFWDGINNVVFSTGDRARTELSTLCGNFPASRCYDFSWDLYHTNDTVFDRSTSNNSLNHFNTFGKQTLNSWSNGKYGAGMIFDGTKQFLYNYDNSNFDFAASEQFTYTVWAKHATIATNPDYLLVKGDPTVTGYKIYMDASGNYCFGIDDDAAFTPDDSACTSGTNYGDSAWHHIAVVKNGTTSISIYIDGVLKTIDSTIAATGTLANSGALAIGVDTDISTNFWEGQLDDLRMYRYARSAEEIMVDMNGGHPLGGSPVGTQVAYWKLDEGTGTTINNSATGTFTTSVSGATWLQQERENQTGGKINGALSFDGSDDVVTVTNADAIDFDLGLKTGVTFSAWIRPGSAGEANAGQIIFKGTNTWFRVDSGSSNLDLAASLDLATTDATVTASDFIPVGSWTHVAMSYSDDADDEVTLWVNGKKVAASTNGVGSPASTDANNLLIGGTTTNNFNGRIDELKVYSSELSTEELRVDFNVNSGINFGTGTSENSNLEDGSGANPVGWWKFDENTGTTIADVSGNGNALTLVNTVAATDWVSGKYGGAYNGDGTNNIAYLNGGATVLEGTQITVSAWVNAANTSTCTTGASCPEVVVYCPRGCFSPGAGYFLDLIGGTVRGGIGNATGFDVAVGATTVSLNTWHHVAMTYDNSTIRVYLDGVLDGSTASTKTILYTDAGAGGPLVKAFYVGNVHDNTASSNTTTANIRHLNGRVDDVKVFNYALTQPMISVDYNRGQPTGYWKMDECTGTTLNDASSQAQQGSSKNGAWTGGGGGNTTEGTCSTSGAWFNGATGKLNASLDFDGTDDVVTVTNTTAIDMDTALSRGFTFSAWVNPATAGEASTGQIYNKGTNTWLRVDTLASGRLDVEANLDYATVDANINVAAAIPTGSWSHVAVAFDSTNNWILLYINGNLVGTSGAGTGGKVADTANLLIGGGTSNNFDGLIDDFKVYSYRQSPEQIKKSMNNEAAVRFGPSVGQPTP